MDNFSDGSSSAEEIIELPDGRRFPVAKFCPTWDCWDGDPLSGLSNTYSNKPLIDWYGKPAFAEIAILEMMKQDGWYGVWVDSFHKKYLPGMPGKTQPTDLPQDVSKRLNLIRSTYREIADRYPELKLSKGNFGGCWDILCWKGPVLRFLEAKRKANDRLQRSQAAWLMAALANDLTTDSFGVVEWVSK